MAYVSTQITQQIRDWMEFVSTITKSMFVLFAVCCFWQIVAAVSASTCRVPVPCDMYLYELQSQTSD